MTATAIISHYNHLNGNDVKGSTLREFHNEIQKYLDKNGTGPHTKTINAIRARIAKAVKTVRKNEVVEVRVKGVKLPVASNQLPVASESKKEVVKVDKKRVPRKKKKKSTSINGVRRIPKKDRVIIEKPFEVISKPSKSGKRTVYYPTIEGKRINATNFGKKWEATNLAKDYIKHKSEVPESQNPAPKPETGNQQPATKNLAGVTYSYKEIDLGPYKKDFHRMFSDTIVMLHGLPGHGKTVWLLKYVQDRAQRGDKVLYVAREEFGRSVFDMKLKEFGINHPNIRFSRTLNPQDIEWADMIFLDSVDALDIDHKKMEEISNGLNKNWYLVKQSTKDGDFRGSQEWEHLVDIASEIRNRKLILRKNRLDPHNSTKREKLLKDDAITEAKKKAEIRTAVKKGMEPKPVQG